MADKFPALKGKTKQDFTGEVSNSKVKNNEPFKLGKKLRDISPKKEKSGLKGDLINPYSDGDWQKTDGMDKTISMQNINKFPIHQGHGNDQEPFQAVHIKSGKDGRMLSPDVGFKNSPEHIKKVKGIKEEVASEIVESYFEEKRAAMESLEEGFSDLKGEKGDNFKKGERKPSNGGTQKKAGKFKPRQTDVTPKGTRHAQQWHFRDNKQQAEWRGVKAAGDRLKEEVEEIDEISKGKLRGYMKDANNDFNRDDISKKQVKKRSEGQNKALDKLAGRAKVPATNEEVEQIDELSPETLDSYKGKAFISQHRGGDKSKPFSDKDQQNYRKRQKGIEMARKRRK